MRCGRCPCGAAPLPKTPGGERPRHAPVFFRDLRQALRDPQRGREPACRDPILTFCCAATLACVVSKKRWTRTWPVNTNARANSTKATRQVVTLRSGGLSIAGALRGAGNCVRELGGPPADPAYCRWGPARAGRCPVKGRSNTAATRRYRTHMDTCQILKCVLLNMK